MSRQRDYQKRKVLEGKCQICGKARNIYAILCDDCERKQRTRCGYGQWKPGGSGRPPKNRGYDSNVLREVIPYARSVLRIKVSEIARELGLSKQSIYYYL